MLILKENLRIGITMYTEDPEPSRYCGPCYNPEWDNWDKRNNWEYTTGMCGREYTHRRGEEHQCGEEPEGKQKMGEMADYISERSNSFPVAYRKSPKVLACRYCGVKNLKWRQHEDSWRLFDGKELHCCDNGSRPDTLYRIKDGKEFVANKTKTMYGSHKYEYLIKTGDFSDTPPPEIDPHWRDEDDGWG